jgi:hypothetical protein
MKAGGGDKLLGETCSIGSECETTYCNLSKKCDIRRLPRTPTSATLSRSSAIKDKTGSRSATRHGAVKVEPGLFTWEKGPSIIHETSNTNNPKKSVSIVEERNIIHSIPSRSRTVRTNKP